MQLDLFADSRDTMLRNDLLAALQARDAAASRLALATLADEFTGDASLGPARLLVGHIGLQTPPLATHAEAMRAIQTLERELHPAAVALFGDTQARHWLRPVWCALAAAAARLPYRPEAPEAHPASLFARTGDWTEVERHVTGIESWRRIPRPLAWAAEACFHLHGLDAAWPLLAELAWRDGARFADLARRLPAPGFIRIVQQFDREFSTATPTDYAWFPAWALVVHTDLRNVLQTAQTPERTAPEEACHVLLCLLTLERQGRHQDVIVQRQRLRDLHGELFDCYMQTRT